MDSRPPRSLRWLGALLVLYLGYPLAAFFVRVATGSNEGWNVPGLWSALSVSVASATASLLIGVITGIPLAYVLARHRGRLSAAVGVLVQLPLALPPLITGIILIYIVGPYSFLGELSGQRLTETIWGLIIAQSFASIPFLVIVARSAFRAVDPALDEVAATLGHGPVARFLRVSVPAASDGIRAGMILMWLRAFGEYGTVVILAYHPYSLPVYVDNLFSSAPLSQAAAPTVLAFAVAALAIALSTVHHLPRSRRLAHRGIHDGGTRPGRSQAVAVPGPAGPVRVGFDIAAHVGTFSLQVSHAPGSHRLAVVGPSGSGKSLTLRSVAGLLGPSVGTVTYGGADVSALPAEQRRVGYVPQGLGLIPGRTVWQQSMFGVGADPARAAWWLEVLHLTEFRDRYPEQLSGGQRQRASLARALAPGPDLVLLDEPFSALDAPVRDELRRELRSLQREAGLSTVLVTHDPQEAAILADEILVLVEGRVLQAGEVRDVYRHPATLQVARLLGIRNVGQGVVGADGVTVACGALALVAGQPLPAGTEMLWSVAPERVRVTTGDPHASSTRPSAGPPPKLHGSVTRRAVVLDLIDLGTCVELTVRLEGGLELISRSTDAPLTGTGEDCLVHLDPDALNVWSTTAIADNALLQT